MTEQKKRVKMNPQDRKTKILKTAINIAIEQGFESITRTEVALKSQCATGLINHYFKNMDNLRSAVIEIAIEDEIIPILVDNLGLVRHALTPTLKRKISNYLIT